MPSVLLVWRLVACRVYIALWRVLGAFLGLLWPSVAMVRGAAFGVLCGVYTSRGSSGIYKPVAARAVYHRRVLGPFAGL